MIITFCNHKGGVGKTANCINFAYTASQSNKRVLIIDCDPQSNCTARLGLEMSDKQNTITDLLENKLLNKSSAVFKIADGIDLIPSNLSLEYTAQNLHRANFAEKRLSNALKEIKHNYDFVLIDTPPALNKLTVNALYASDLVLIVVNRSLDAISGLVNILNLCNEVVSENKKLQIKVLRTFVNEKTKLTNAALDESLNAFKHYLLKTTIPERESINQAAISGKSLIEQDKNSIAVKAYTSLLKEVQQCQN